MIPKGDGQYMTWSDNYGAFKVHMQVTGNGKPYIHDLTVYRKPERYMNAGCLQFFFDCATTN